MDKNCICARESVHNKILIRGSSCWKINIGKAFIRTPLPVCFCEYYVCPKRVHKAHAWLHYHSMHINGKVESCWNCKQIFGDGSCSPISTRLFHSQTTIRSKFDLTTQIDLKKDNRNPVDCMWLYNDAMAGLRISSFVLISPMHVINVRTINSEFDDPTTTYTLNIHDTYITTAWLMKTKKLPSIGEIRWNSLKFVRNRGDN